MSQTVLSRRDSRSTTRTEPTEAWLFAQILLGNPIRGGFRDQAHEHADRERLEWLAQISTVHAAQRRSLLEKEHHAREERARLEWLAGISPRHERALRRQLASEAEALETRSRFERFVEAWELQEAAWDPAKHPRQGGPPNAGWFATTGGTESSSKASDAAPAPSHPTAADASAAAPPITTKTQLPAAARGSWVSGTKGDGVFHYNNALENQRAGLAGKAVRFEKQYIAVGGFPPEVYYKGNASAASVEINVVTGTTTDGRAADAAMRKKLGDPKWRRPDGYAWNHAGTPGSKVMELVEKPVHDAISHKGPAAESRALRRQASRAARTGGATGRVMAALTVYLTARDALQAAGALQPDYEAEARETYHYVADDGSVFIVWPAGLFSGASREFVSGPRKGQTEKLASEDVEAYRKQAEEEWGKYIPSSLFSEPRFIPGKRRKSLPLIEYRNGIRYDAGWIDEDGVHRHPNPKALPI